MNLHFGGLNQQSSGHLAPSISATGNPFWECSAYIGFFILVVFAKSPEILIHPRFWAEEGAVFYINFLHLSFLHSILFVKSGAIQLLTNIIVYLSTEAPVTAAPAVTTYLSFGFQIIVILQLFLFARAYNLTRQAGLLLVAAVSFLPQSFEVWLNSTNLQWIAGLSALLIFAMPACWITRHYRMAATWCFLCGLAGVPATILVPVFVCRAIIERSVPLAVITLALGLSAIVQLAVLKSVGGEPRPYRIDLYVLTVPLLLQSVLSPLLSADVADRIGRLILSPNPRVHVVSSAVSMVGGLGIIGLVMLAASSARRSFVQIWLIMFAWAFVSMIQNFGSISPGPEEFSGWVGGRYFLFGAVCFCLLLAWGTSARYMLGRILSIGLLWAMVVSGIYTISFSQWPSGMLHGPRWRSQIEKCSASQTCRIKIWPDPWFVEIEKPVGVRNAG